MKITSKFGNWRRGGGVLKALIFLPVAGALVVAVFPVRRALLLWQIAMFFALAALGYSLWLATHFDPAGPAIQMFESRAWNARLGSYFALGVDGISLAMLLLTALLTLIAVLVSRRMEAGARLYFTLVLLLESAIFGVFTARDWSLFYVFWEATLLPLVFPDRPPGWAKPATGGAQFLSVHAGRLGVHAGRPALSL
jgi:NADH-quinone oxidoreductase subunit M